MFRWTRGATTAPHTSEGPARPGPQAGPAAPAAHAPPCAPVASRAWREWVREAVVELDRDGRIVHATPGRGGALADLADDLPGRFLVDQLRAGDRVVLLHAIARVRAGERRVEADLDLRLDDAGRAWTTVGAAVLPEDAAAERLLVLIDERAEALAPPPAATDRADDTTPADPSRAADPGRAADDDAFAELAHELRTPLNAVMGFGQALEAGLFGTLSERQRDAVVAIVEASEHLVEVANAVLDAARLRDAGATITFERGSVAPAVVRSCSMVSAIAGRHEVTLANRVTERSGEARHDAAALRQIAVNLLSNAIKASEPGAVVGIEARRTVVDGAPGMEIAVHDTGRGMTDDEMARLGRRFGREQPCDGESTGGLGLPLVRRLVARHGGMLRFASAPGAGTTASVFLPDDEPRAAGDAVPPGAPHARSHDAPRARSHDAARVVPLVHEAAAGAVAPPDGARDGAMAPSSEGSDAGERRLAG